MFMIYFRMKFHIPLVAIIRPKDKFRFII